MKTKIFYIALLLAFSQIINAQVIFGNQSTTSSQSVLIEFESINNTKGIILPHVATDNNNYAAGTLIFDTKDNIIKVKLADKWQELTENETTYQEIINTSSDNGKGVIIGTETENTPEGVLVLSADDKSLVLPKITNPTEKVKGPYAGMICYDTASKSLAVYDGNFWHYWK